MQIMFSSRYPSQNFPVTKNVKVTFRNIHFPLSCSATIRFIDNRIFSQKIPCILDTAVTHNLHTRKRCIRKIVDIVITFDIARLQKNV